MQFPHIPQVEFGCTEVMSVVGIQWACLLKQLITTMILLSLQNMWNLHIQKQAPKPPQGHVKGRITRFARNKYATLQTCDVQSSVPLNAGDLSNRRQLQN